MTMSIFESAPYISFIKQLNSLVRNVSSYGDFFLAIGVPS